MVHALTTLLKMDSKVGSNVARVVVEEKDVGGLSSALWVALTW